MISRKWQALIGALHQKKYRREHGLFLVEGAKNVLELLASSFTVRALATTEAFYSAHIRPHGKHSFEWLPATAEELTRLGTLQTNEAALAVAEIRPNQPLVAESNEYVLVLDGVRDPGNLGTLLRIADWYGLTKLVCSPDTAELYNPKVIAASMGSFTRVQVYECDLAEYFAQQGAVPVYGAFLAGKNVHQTQFATAGYLLMGSESHGISEQAAAYVTERIHIPRYGGAESLNVAVASAVILDTIRNNLTPVKPE